MLKNSVIRNISYAGFIKKNKGHLEILEVVPFFDSGSYFVKCSANIPYPIISNKWQNFNYLNSVPKSRM